MYDLDYSKVKSNKIVGIIIICIALLLGMFFTSIFFDGMIRKMNTDETVIADRVTIEISYEEDEEGEEYETFRPTYYYQVEGRAYKYTPSYYTSYGVEDMKDKTLYYNSSEPEYPVAKYETIFYSGYWFFVVVIVVFIVAGVGFIISSFKLKKKLNHLEEKGILLNNLPCKVLETNAYVNDEPVLLIEADYILSSGELIKFKTKKVGEFYDLKTIDVLVDPDDLSIYHMDVNIR